MSKQKRGFWRWLWEEYIHLDLHLSRSEKWLIGALFTGAVDLLAVIMVAFQSLSELFLIPIGIIAICDVLGLVYSVYLDQELRE